MIEIICNLHIHSTYSDGSGTYTQILDSAAQAGVDIVILTDHNILVKGVEGFYEYRGKKVLFLTGEEVHNQARHPQKNHMLVFGAGTEMATNAYNPQLLINSVNQAGGLTFLAHPDEYSLPLFHEDDISWVDWDIDGFTGFELWNGLSELKTVSQSLGQLVKHAFFPELMAHGPLPQTLHRWDELLARGKHLSVVGGSDSHALVIHIGPFTKIIFPYVFHFSAINNHLLLPEKLSGDLAKDEKSVYSALKKGSSFVGYDLPASTKGFLFTIQNDTTIAHLGDSFSLDQGATVYVKIPQAAELRLIRNGQIIYESHIFDRLAFPISEPGVYRVECYIKFLGQRRGWIFSNPIYVSRD